MFVKKMKKNELVSRIVVNPDIMAGKPIIKGNRLAVEHVLDLLSEGMSIEEIIEEHTQLTKEGVLACISFASSELRGRSPL